ncbi:hypothetical protein ACS0TY_015454 [Phlomoides rotata]
MGIAFGIVSGFVNERIRNCDEEGGRDRDFLDVLLEFEDSKRESGKLSKSEIIIFILEMFLVGTETTSNNIEWAMTELLAIQQQCQGPNPRFRASSGPHKIFKKATSTISHTYRQ